MKKPAIVVLCLAALLTAAFHFFFAERPLGLPFAILVTSALIGIALLVKLAGQRVNRWAYLFLIPVVFATASKIMYSSEVVFALGFVVAIVSLAFFAYWISAPHVSFWQVKTLWPFSFFIETAWPFRSLNTLFTGLQSGKQGVKILIGFVLAIPFIFIIGALFASADPLFNKTITDIFRIADFEELLGKTIRDVIAFMFFLGSGWTIFTRSMDKRHPEHRDGQALNPGVVVVGTFLALLNLLFLVFLGFQVAYFFGGESFIRDQGLTYAEYARSGFFQLLVVAGIVFVLSWFVYRATELRDLATKILTCALIVQTGVIIVSAIKRLLLYIDAYGLSVSRWWAMTSIAIIASVLLFVFVSALMRQRFDRVAKLTGIGFLIAISTLLLVNVEGMVVKMNVERYLSGKTDIIDIAYMDTLSSDALPEMVAFAKKDPKMDVQVLRKRADALRKQVTEDWRYFTLSDYFAMKAVATLL